MKALLTNGYTPKLRPSGHDISDKFGKDNGGSVPGCTTQFCNVRELGLVLHPYLIVLVLSYTLPCSP
jgi:site-specific DNA-methyltransferase (cytosine-N4-specific)